MNKELRSKFPSWVDEQGDYTLCLSNDLDSLLGCKILQNISSGDKDNYAINHFYSFDSLYTADRADKRQAIGVDLALTKGKCWDNHVTLLNADDEPNQDSANLNNILGYNCETNYKYKYAFSTSLLICSYYGFFPTKEQAKMLLLCIDSSYLGYFSGVQLYKDIFVDWFERLGLEDFLDILERHNKEDFVELSDYYQLKRTIKVEDGHLVTDLDLPAISKALGINLELPTAKFQKVKQLKQYRYDIQRYKRLRAASTSDREPFSLAATGKNTVCFSI